jgi:hypothetical protein
MDTTYKESVVSMRICSVIVVLSLLAACASHRTAPPECNGPYTPVNPAMAVAANGTQPGR